MEIAAWEREWHGIPLTELRDSPSPRADASFYEDFYRRFLEEAVAPDPQWLAPRQALAAWIEANVLRPNAGAGPERPTVLSLGAGLGVMEEVWIEHGYRVAVQECQPRSLEGFRARHPEAPVYVGDARHVQAPAGAFDIVVLAALDYVYARHQYSELLAEVGRLLAPGGHAAMVSVSNLSVRGAVRALAREVLVRLRGDWRARRVVMWGWKRTVREHLRLGRCHGLRAVGVYAFDDGFRVVLERIPPALNMAPLPTSKSAVVWARE